MAAQLAALNKEAVKDNPHEKAQEAAKARKAAEAKKNPKKVASKPRPTKPTASDDHGNRERTAVNLSSSSVDALKKLQAFLVTDCGARTANASAAICIALELASEAIPVRKEVIKKHYEALQKTDGRRK